MDDLHFMLNGKPAPLDNTAPTQTLLRWLHGQGLSGTKEGCGDGDCGACTVVLVETDAAGKRAFRAVNSCLLPVGQLAGREVLTVEALAERDVLHPVQQAMVDCAGSQCGYCTPGFVMSLFAGYYGGELDDATTDGNLCRCTGYRSIRSATAQLADVHGADRQHDDRFLRLLAAPGPMAAFEMATSEVFSADTATSGDRFLNPSSLDAALQARRAHPDAHWLCGATDLGVELSRGRGTARHFIAVDRIAEMHVVSESDTDLRIGAAVPLARIERELHGRFKALDTMLHWFAARQVKNRATIGGNLGTASPIGDLPPVLLALGAIVECRGIDGERSIPIDDFFLDYRRTALAPGELIVAVRIPRIPAGQRFVEAAYKVAKRPTDDISIVAAAFALSLDAEDRVSDIRMAYGGVAAIPLRASRTEAFLRRRMLDDASIAQAGELLQQEFTPLTDHRAGADYRRALCASLFARFVAEHVPCQA
jgi:xanthine dehydrogenase small subunit